MELLSVSEAAKEFGEKPDTIYKAVQRGYLKCFREDNGEIKISKKDLVEYFKKLQPPEWYDLAVLSLHFKIPRCKLQEDLDEGTLDGSAHKRKTYIHNEEWIRYLSKNFDYHKSIDTSCSANGEFTVLNSRGIHTRPAFFFCVFSEEHPENLITLFYNQDSWIYECPYSSREKLVAMEIHQGESVEVVVSGKGSQKHLKHILKAAANSFGVME